MDPLLAPLTPAQRVAVEHIDGPLLILAGPGSGKTRTITHRIANLLRQGVPARQIVALTFTNKAVDEMRSRVEAMAAGEMIWVSTFHRFGANLLRKYASLVGIDERFTIYDTDDSRQVPRRVLEEMDLVGPHCGPERIAAAIRGAKNRLVTADEYRPRGNDPTEEVTAIVYPEYQARLLASSAVDFDDLLLHLAVLLRNNPALRATLDDHFRYVLVDEYQDTNLAQYVILRAISSDHPNLAVTGDPDQSIYGWRGANISNILDFEADYPQACVVRLEQNWRSTQRILRVADRLILHNRRRKPKTLVTDNEEGKPVGVVAYATEQEEAEGIAAAIAESIRSTGRSPADFAIFYRVNALSRPLEIALSDQGVPYKLIHAVEFYRRKEVRDILAYAQLINNPRDDVAFLRIVNTPARGIGQRTLERVAQHSAGKQFPLLAAARESGRITSLPKRSATGITRFVRLYDLLSEYASGPVEDLLRKIVAETKYRKQF
ncbi:MAG: ATP-dependent helicase, partial [Pirellulales bacterium]